MRNVKLISLYITPELLLEIEEYRHDFRHKTRNGAIIHLIEKGLSQPEVKVREEPRG